MSTLCIQIHNIYILNSMLSFSTFAYAFNIKNYLEEYDILRLDYNESQELISQTKANHSIPSYSILMLPGEGKYLSHLISYGRFINNNRHIKKFKRMKFHLTINESIVNSHIVCHDPKKPRKLFYYYNGPMMVDNITSFFKTSLDITVPSRNAPPPCVKKRLKDIYLNPNADYNTEYKLNQEKAESKFDKDDEGKHDVDEYL